MGSALKHLTGNREMATLWLVRLLRGHKERDFGLIRESQEELRRIGIHVSIGSPTKQGRILRPDRSDDK